MEQKRYRPGLEILQGTLDMLILQRCSGARNRLRDWRDHPDRFGRSLKIEPVAHRRCIGSRKGG